MHIEWDKHANSWETNSLARDYSDAAYNSLLRVLKKHKIDLRSCRVMDFGCGTGLLSEKLSPEVGEIVSIDSSKKMIEQLEDKNLLNVWALTADVDPENRLHFPVLTDKFDLILACSVCSFLQDYESKLDTLAQLLTPGGLFIQWDWMQTDENNEYGLNKKQIKSAYTRADLQALKLGKAFEMSSGNESLPVIMGVAKRSH